MPYNQCCEGTCPTPAPTPAPAPALAPGGGEPTSALAGVLDGYKGQTHLSCHAVCSAKSGQYYGYGWSQSGSTTTWTCHCSTGTVNIDCEGEPYDQCCEGTCPPPAPGSPAAAAACQSTPRGWSCPADGGCSGGGCTGDFQEWVAAHNVYRCMHDVPAVSWNEAVFQDAYGHFAHMPHMSHSQSYQVPPPAGPAGENLYYHSASHNAADAVQMWYSEINDCPSFPGCQGYSTGHFTAMMWQGATEIGCLSNPYNIVACRYKGADKLGCSTPNFGDASSYAQNVYPRVKTYTECKAAVEACGLTVEAPLNDPSVDGTTGLYEDNMHAASNTLPTYILPGMIVLVAAAAAVGGVMRFRRHSAAQASASADEGLE